MHVHSEKISSPGKYTLQHLLKSTNKNFDVIAITEARIRKDISITSNSSSNNYSLNLQLEVLYFLFSIIYHTSHVMI